MALYDLVKPRICELGKLKLGGRGEERPSKAGGTYRLPVKYDFFVVTNLIRDDATGNFRTDEIVMSELAAAGFADKDGKVRQLPIALMSNEIEDALQARYCWYEGGRLAAVSDGVKLTKYIDTSSTPWGWLKEPLEVPWKEEYLTATDPKDSRRKLFKMNCTFNCMLALKQSKFGGVYRLRTTSQITASQLYGSLSTIKQITGGYLRGVPLLLAMRPMEVSPDGKKTKIYVVHVELVGEDLLQIQNMVLERAKIDLQRRQELDKTLLEFRRILNAPGENESVTEQQDTSEEFHPEEHQDEEKPEEKTSEQNTAASPIQDDPLLAQMAEKSPEKSPEPTAAAPAASSQSATTESAQTATPAAAVPSPATLPAAPVVSAEQQPSAPPAAGPETPAPKKRGRPPKPKPATEPWDRQENGPPKENSSTIGSGHAPVGSAERVEEEERESPQESSQDTVADQAIENVGNGENNVDDWQQNISRQIQGATRSIHIQKIAELVNEATWVPEDIRDKLLDQCYAANLALASPKKTGQSPPTNASTMFGK